VWALLWLCWQCGGSLLYNFCDLYGQLLLNFNNDTLKLLCLSPLGWCLGHVLCDHTVESASHLHMM
jgi:hypothetical protein